MKHPSYTPYQGKALSIHRPLKNTPAHLAQWTPASSAPSHVPCPPDKHACSHHQHPRILSPAHPTTPPGAPSLASALRCFHSVPSTLLSLPPCLRSTAQGPAQHPLPPFSYAFHFYPQSPSPTSPTSPTPTQDQARYLPCSQSSARIAWKPPGRPPPASSRPRFQPRAPQSVEARRTALFHAHRPHHLVLPPAPSWTHATTPV